MLSGVGPADHLASLNIPLVMDLPVGEKIQDHTNTLAGPFLKSPSVNPSRDINIQAVNSFLTNGSGILAATSAGAGQGFLKSPVAHPNYADLQIIHSASALHPRLPQDLNHKMGLRVDILEKWFDPYHKMNTDARFGTVVLGRPKSFGKMMLASTNPYDNPIIDPQYLTHPDDIEALLYGFKKFVDLYENTEVLNTKLFPKPVPGCESEVFKSDDYYRCVIKMFSFTMFHHVGSCALGKVVDNELRVIGIDGLRVIDASVMPRLPNGNTQAATIMIAEKGSDLVSKSVRSYRYGNTQFKRSKNRFWHVT
ncbi:Glucose dehydrogenase [FAD, quinone] [Orchesella cincta]|uniref:Glucose dehydrogenase [FAD, quinone] n=1 Tax=Orchesella cincta TaxID=48709 RepID=A0A1D2MAU8_ORCCI|nr:Glucose dehydrogenase [FAD, quinone] [Orchesella cincta]